MEIITQFKQKEAIALARSVMWNDANKDTRMLAASMVWEAGDPQAFKAIFPLLKPRQLQGDMNFEQEHILEFLAKAHQPAVIRAFASDFSKMSSQSLSAIVKSTFNVSREPLHKSILAEQEKVKADYERGVEALLTHMVTRLDGISADSPIQWKQKRGVLEPDYGRAGDIAGALLAFMHPDKYRFSLNTPLRQREIQRIILLNQLRKEQNLPPFTVPTLPTRKQPRNTLSQILFANDTSPLPPSPYLRLMALQGSKLEKGVLARRLEEVLASLPPNTRGLYVEIDSAGNGTGIRLFLKFIPGKMKGTGSRLILSEKIVSDSGIFGYGSGTLTISQRTTSHLNEMLSIPQNSSFETYLTLVVRRVTVPPWERK